ncbi:MAG: hypothetical protein RLZZ383_243, partial [Pseudomonadota bacterium]
MWTRRRLLASSASVIALPSLVRAVGSAPPAPRRLVVVYVDGGWDTTFVLDPKFQSAYVDGPQVDEDRSQPDDRERLMAYGDLLVVSNPFKRPAVDAYFERWGSQTAIVNGIGVGSLAHPPCRVRAMTGTALDRSASFSTIIGAALGGDRPLGSVDMSGMAFTGPLAATVGRLGAQNQLRALVDDTVPIGPPASLAVAYPQFTATPSDRDALAAHLDARTRGLATSFSSTGDNARKLADRVASLLRASRFRGAGADALAGLTSGLAPTLTEQADLAIELLQADLCATVTLNSGEFWDTHALNVNQHGLWQRLFAGLDHLMSGLDAADLLASTTVVVLSEMTRSPLLNARAGKDHWPHMSLLLMGAGVRGGRTYGGTDARGESLAVDTATGAASAL